MSRRVLLLTLFGAALGVSACSGPPRPGAEDEEREEAAQHYVQLRMTEDRSVAEEALGTALAWWEDEREALPAPRVEAPASPVTIAWRAPLYRVRLGPFYERAQAATVLQAAENSFPEAFIARERAPDTSSP